MRIVTCPGGRLAALALALTLAAPACNHRIPITGSEDDGGLLPPQDGAARLDRPQIPPDGAPLPDAPWDPDAWVPPDAWVGDFTTPSSPCLPESPTNPDGMKPVVRRTNTQGDWQVASRPTARYNDLVISSPGSARAAATIDHITSGQEVAGFVVSLPGRYSSLEDERNQLFTAILGGVTTGGGKMSVRSSGTRMPRFDLFPQFQGTIIDVSYTKGLTVSAVRKELVASMLGRASNQLGNLPPAFGATDTGFVVSLVTVRRFQLKLDPKTGQPLEDKDGYGVDTGNKSHWRVLVMGSVTRSVTYANPNLAAGLIADDLASGTLLALPAAKLATRCDKLKITKLPEADIIWVMDESGSMNNNRADIVKNANQFFARAKASNMDFRMGVTNVCDPNGSHAYAVGKFCSVATTDRLHAGGDDRFLLPSEQTIFSACIENPPGYEGGREYGLINSQEAVLRHLPRSTGSSHNIRKEAALAVIVATDEVPMSIHGLVSTTEYRQCTLSASSKANLDKHIKPFVDFFAGKSDPEAKTMFHVIGGVCSNTCAAQVAHGYRELAQQLGGLVGDVCQSNLGKTLQAFIDSVVGEVSPIRLDYTPVSATLAVSLGSRGLKRSRVKGFDYRAPPNAVAFINVKVSKGQSVMAGYKRWK